MDIYGHILHIIIYIYMFIYIYIYYDKFFIGWYIYFFYLL